MKPPGSWELRDNLAPALRNNGCTQVPRMRGLGAIGALGLALMGCARGPIEEHSPTGRSRSAIIAGKTSPASQDFVVMLAMRPGGKLEGVCSGTLVAPNVVLTALHCVSD